MKTTTLCLLGALLASVPAQAGGEVQNGGDSVLCQKAPGSDFDGYYALDYLLTLQSDNSDLVQIASWEQSRARLESLLGGKYPDLARLLTDYLRYLPIDSSIAPDQRYLQPRIWEEAPFGLVDIQDQRIIRKLPANCASQDGSGGIHVIQSVIRQKPGTSTLYSYDPGIYRELREKHALQFSFLVVHEWLWDFTDDVQLIRRVNRLLHSTQLDRLSAEELRTALANVGFTLRPEYVPVCDRTPAIRQGIEKTLLMPCAELTPAVLDAQVSEIFLAGAGIESLRDGDFSGLNKARSIDLSHNSLGNLLEDLLAGLYSLNTLDLTGNSLEELPEGLFADTGNLTGLKLGSNRLKSLPAKLFARTPRLEFLDLSDNRLERLPPGIFASLGTASINLARNPIGADEMARIRAEYADARYHLRFSF